MPEQGAGCVELRGDVAPQVVAGMGGAAVGFLRLQETTHAAAGALLVVAGVADVAVPFMHRAAAAEGELIGVGGAGYCASAARDAAGERIVAVLVVAVFGGGGGVEFEAGEAVEAIVGVGIC